MSFIAPLKMKLKVCAYIPQCHMDSDSCTHYVIFNIDFVQLLVAKVTGYNQLDMIVIDLVL